MNLFNSEMNVHQTIFKMDSTKWDSLKLYFTRIFRFCLILCFKAVVDASVDVAYEASTVMVVVTGNTQDLTLIQGL